MDFETAAAEVLKLQSCSNEDKLELYGLFKQVKFGDVNIDRPGLFSIEAKAKWDSWNSRKGMSNEKAREEYVAKVQLLLNK